MEILVFLKSHVLCIMGRVLAIKPRFIFLQAEPALMYDSVQVFAVGLRTLEQSHALRPANISCELEHPWDGGLSLTNYINSVSFSLLHFVNYV